MRQGIYLASRIFAIMCSADCIFFVFFFRGLYSSKFTASVVEKSIFFVANALYMPVYALNANYANIMPNKKFIYSCKKVYI